MIHVDGIGFLHSSSNSWRRAEKLPSVDRLFAGAGPGHCFAILSDLRFLGCDAYLLPGGAWPTRNNGWIVHGPISKEYLKTVDWTSCSKLNPKQRCWVFPDFPLTVPLPVWTLTGRSAKSDPRNEEDRVWVIEGVRQFMRTAAQQLKTRNGGRPLNRRARHLVALPVLGTGAGGFRPHLGRVLRLVWAEAERAAYAYGFDVAVVSNEPSVYACLQQVRAQRLGLESSPASAEKPADAASPASASTGDGALKQTSEFHELDRSLRQTARRLAELAAAGRLVLFIGAGVSAGAGLPLWGSLLERLGQEAGLAPVDFKWLQTLSFLDRASILERRLAQTGSELRSTVARLIKDASSYHSIAHAILATLPSDEIVTTNYDTLFEQASVAAGRPCSVLPYDSIPHGTGATDYYSLDGLRRKANELTPRWCLKLHGCVNHADDIVLTRDDYIRFHDRRAALQGLVQSLLLTKHMLFVGFSLTDDNFYAIADSVSKALPPSSRRHFGTALILHNNPFTREIWSNSLIFAPIVEQVSPPESDFDQIQRLKLENQQLRDAAAAAACEDDVGDNDNDFEEKEQTTEEEEKEEEGPVSIGEAARLNDIFLDLLGLHTFVLGGTRRSHILDDKFDGALSSADRAFRDHLLDCVRRIPREAVNSVAFGQLEQFVAGLGLYRLQQQLFASPVIEAKKEEQDLDAIKSPLEEEDEASGSWTNLASVAAVVMPLKRRKKKTVKTNKGRKKKT